MTKSWNVLEVPFRALGRNGMRSRLTALGMIIGVACVVATIGTSAQVVYGNQNWSTSVHGAEVDWPLVRAWNLASGQFFTDQVDLIVAPYETVRRKVMGTTAVGSILASAISNDHVPVAEEEIAALLRQRHRIDAAAGQADDFSIRSQVEMLQRAADQSRTMATLLWSIAGVSLLVGGIGIMNIMLVSVTERTREIGVRLAVGARGSDIRAQFLVEAIALSASGGLLGIALGAGIQRAIAAFAGWPVVLQGEAVALAFAFSAAIGVAFGIYPAWRASTLDPIEALRYE